MTSLDHISPKSFWSHSKILHFLPPVCVWSPERALMSKINSTSTFDPAWWWQSPVDGIWGHKADREDTELESQSASTKKSKVSSQPVIQTPLSGGSLKPCWPDPTEQINGSINYKRVSCGCSHDAVKSNRREVNVGAALRCRILSFGARESACTHTPSACVRACFVYLVICHTFKANGVPVAAQIVISAGQAGRGLSWNTSDEEDPQTWV